MQKFPRISKEGISIMRLTPTCTDVIDPLVVVVILSCIVPISVARVGW